MGKKINIVTVPSTDVEVDGFVAQKLALETGDKRTLFFVFKSDDVDTAAIVRFQNHLKATMAPEEGTRLVVLAMDAEDSFEIHELED